MTIQTKIIIKFKKTMMKKTKKILLIKNMYKHAFKKISNKQSKKNFI